jgi:ATP-binding cassette subfamily B multidrug efflux pump
MHLAGVGDGSGGRWKTMPRAVIIRGLAAALAGWGAGDEGTLGTPLSLGMITKDALLHPVRAGAPEVTNRQLLRWMFGFLAPVKPLVVLACVYLTLRTGAELLAVYETGQAVTQIKVVQFSGVVAQGGFRAWITGAGHDAVGLRRIILLLAACTLALALFTYLREVSSAKLSMEMVFYIREAVYDKLQRVGFGFHDTISTGELINRALSDLQNVRAFVNSAVLVTLEIALIVGGCITLFLTRSVWVALLAMVPLPIWTWYIMRFSRKAQPTLTAVMEAGDKNVSIITENIAGVHVVKAFASEQQEIGKYGQSCDTFFSRVMKRIGLFANFTPVVRGIAIASHLSLFLAVGILMIKGRLDPGDILMLGWAMGAILGRLQQVAAINDQYQNAIVSARRMHEVLSASPTVREGAEARSLPPGPGKVRMEQVTFGYDPAKPVLRDLSFEVAGGSIAAVVGPTGAGKTTLVNLIARFYDPQRGRILIDGTDIREVTLESLRKEIAYVFQETYLFSDTVEANVAYGRPHVQGGEVEAVTRLAQAHEFVETLPRGYQTMLGERGASLSGGQRQRLAIARAILSNPRILILDDATAAIDPETEDLIRRGLDFVLQDRTTFVIAHRISTVQRADAVIVLENGRITQIGTHEELMQRNGHYRDIAAVQLFGDQLDPDGGSERPGHVDRLRDAGVVSAAAAAAKELDAPDSAEGL